MGFKDLFTKKNSTSDCCGVEIVADDDTEASWTGHVVYQPAQPGDGRDSDRLVVDGVSQSWVTISGRGVSGWARAHPIRCAPTQRPATQNRP